MTASGQETCETFAEWLKSQALWPAVIVATVFVASPLAALAVGIAFAGATMALLTVATIGGLATLALCGLIRFDAGLFHLMASHRDEAAGGAAVDDLLERMRLKAKPERRRTLDERVAGARRLVTRQRFAFGIFASAVVLMPIATLT